MKTLRYLCLVVALGACQTYEPFQLPAGFEATTWQADRLACNGTRAAQLGAFRQLSDQLQRRSQAQVTQLLGKPDVHDLGQRSTKNFTYYLSPGSQCPDQMGTPGRAVRLRFNSLGVVDEVSYLNF